MANNIDVKDAASVTKTVKSTDNASVHTPHHNVDAVIPGTGATNLGKAEDAAHSSGDTGVMILAVRKATPADLSGADGDYEPLQMDEGYLWVRQAAGAAHIAKLEDAASAGGDMGVGVMARRTASPADQSGTDGDYEFIQMDNGRVWVSATVDAALPAGTNNIGDVDVVSVTLPTAIHNGKTTVASTTTTAALGSTQALVSGVNIKAEASNTGIIYVGDGSVVAADGYELAAGESVFLEIDDIAAVGLATSVAGDGVTYVGS